MPPDSNALSPRECQIVPLVAAGKLNKEIAHELGLSVGTVKEYMFRIMRKLSFTNRTELAVWYVSAIKAPKIP